MPDLKPHVSDDLLVVDSRLNVYGVKNLKVTDVRIAPFPATELN